MTSRSHRASVPDEARPATQQCQLIRYAGANRLKVDIDYRLLFVVNDRGQLRGYRADRIAGVRPTDENFRSSFRVEF